MIALLQRVTSAHVTVNCEVVGSIGKGLLVLLGVRPGDTEDEVQKLLSRILKYRVFNDGAGKMNASLQQSGGALLLVPQFTLAADTRSGLRPGFSTAAPPELGKRLFDAFVTAARVQHAPVETGQFGAHMEVSLVNDGPATFWLET